MDYKSKYLKYKNKYEALKSQTGGQPKIVQKSSDDNDDRNIYIEQRKPYWDLFYSNLNQNTDNDQKRYSDVQLKPKEGRIIERLVGDIIDLKVIVKKLEKKIDDHYHEVPTTGVRYFNKGQKGPIPDYQSTVEKASVDGPKIVPVDGPKIVPVQGEGPMIVPVDGRKIVEKDPETGEWNTTIMEVPQKKDPFLVKKDPVTGEYNVGFKSGPKIVQEEGQSIVPVKGDGPNIVPVKGDGPKFEQKFNCTFSVGDVVVDRIEGYGIVYEIKGNELHVINDLTDYPGIPDNKLNWTANNYHNYKLCNETKYFKKSTVYVSPQSLVDTFSRKWWYESEKQQILIDFIKEFNLKKPEEKKGRKSYEEEFNE